MADSTPRHDLFICHAREDTSWVEGYLLDALEKAGVRCHTEEAFELGLPRALAFQEAVKASRKTLLVISPYLLADGFAQFVEVLATTYALVTGKWQVIPLVLREVPPDRMLWQDQALTSLDATLPEKWPAAVQRLCALFEREVQPAGDIPACPYPGMRPFREDEAKYYFGRRQEDIDRLVRELRAKQFLAVIGASGSGKSSFVRAGLLPRLKHAANQNLFGGGDWRVIELTPGAKPFQRLREQLGADPEQPRAALDRLLKEQPSARRVLVFVDQFEELFTQSERAEQEQFARVLPRLSREPDCYVLLTARADYYPELMACEPVWPLVRDNRTELPPLSEVALREAVARPAEMCEPPVAVDPALVERLAAHAAGEREAGALPLLQETLQLLWPGLLRRHLPVGAYDALGCDGCNGLQVAMSLHADQVIQRIRSEVQPDGEAIARQYFLRLVQFGEGRSDIRRRQSQQELLGEHQSEHEKAVLRLLIDGRLLTASGGEGDADREIDIAHEKLIHGWPRLHQWLEEGREGEAARRRLRDAVEEWRSGKRGLMGEVDVTNVEADVARCGTGVVEVPERVEEWVQQSRGRLQRNWWFKWSAVVLIGAAACAAGIAAVLALEAKRETIAERNNGEIRRLAAHSDNELKARRWELALLLACEACKRGDIPEARASLLWALQKVVAVKTILQGHESWVASVAFSPDGNTLASGDDGGFVILWDLNRRLMGIWKAEEGFLSSVAFSPDGNTVASGGADHLALLDITDFRKGHRISRVATGPFGKPSRLIWDGLKQKVIGDKNLRPSSGGVTSVAFSPVGKALAWGEIRGVVALVESMDGPSAPIFMDGHKGEVTSMAFTPDGKTLASVGIDRVVILWDVAGRQKRSESVVQRTSIISAAFNSNGTTLALGGSNSRAAAVALFSVASPPRVLDGLPTSSRLVTSVAFSADGKTLAWGGENGEIGLQNLTERDANSRALSGHSDTVVSLAFSPDGKTLASGGDRSVVLWDVAKARPRNEPPVERKDFMMDEALHRNDDLRSLQDRASRIVNRNLSRAEWAGFIGPDVPYRLTFEDLPPGEGAEVGKAPRDQQ